MVEAGGALTDTERALELLDRLLELARESTIAEIEVEHEGTIVSLTRAPGRTGPAVLEPVAEAPVADAGRTVHAPTVGIFSAVRDWTVGDLVQRGDPLGGIQSLGHVAEISAPAEGAIREVLVTGGSPVEYGQALFVIAVADADA